MFVALRKVSVLAALPALAAALLSVACRSAAPPPAPPPPAVNTEALAEQARREACEQDLTAAREALAASEKVARAAEARVVELSGRLLEQSAELQSSADRQAALQRQLDDAVQEVVRAKAKLRSLESRADAASAMAEAEIALKALQGRKGGANRQELGKAEELLRMSGDEFERENYGGALFLATQAKSHLRAAEVVPAPKGAAVPGEVPLVSPLRLLVHTDANVRQGPGMTFPVIATMPSGMVVTATARKNRWLRVTDDRGITGWVFDGLLSER